VHLLLKQLKGPNQRNLQNNPEAFCLGRNVPTPARGKSLEGKRNGGMAPEVGTEAQSKKGRKNNVCGARASHVPVEAVEQPHPSQ